MVERLTSAEIHVFEDLLARSDPEDDVGLYVWYDQSEAKTALLNLVRKGYAQIYEARWVRGGLETMDPLEHDPAKAALNASASWGTGDQLADARRGHLRVSVTHSGRRAFEARITARD